MNTSQHTEEDTFFCLFYDNVLVTGASWVKKCVLWSNMTRVLHHHDPWVCWCLCWRRDNFQKLWLTNTSLSRILAMGLSLQSMSWILIQFLLCDLQSVSSPEFLWPLLWIILSDIRYPARLPGSRNHKHNICSQYFETVTCVTYILENCRKGTDKCDKNICDSAWQNINCPQICVPVSRCLY